MTTDLTTLRRVSNLLSVPDDEDMFFGETASDYIAKGHKERSDMLLETGELMGFVASKTSEKASLQRFMSSTFSMLRKAHNMLEKAEVTISEQESRIEALEKLTSCDELTGLKNKRGFFESFLKELERCERGVSKGGLIVLIDLDDFKSVNDKYGHMAGDACLRLVSRTLQDETRAMDVAARLGGDEFVVLLANTTANEATPRAHNIGWLINHLGLSWYGDHIPLQTNIGIKSFGAGDVAEDIFNAADMDLYACKRNKCKSIKRNN